MTATLNSMSKKRTHTDSDSSDQPPKTSKPSGTTVRMYTDDAEILELVAKDSGKSIAEVLRSLVREHLMDRYKEFLRIRMKKADQE